MIGNPYKGKRAAPPDPPAASKGTRLLFWGSAFGMSQIGEEVSKKFSTYYEHVCCFICWCLAALTQKERQKLSHRVRILLARGAPSAHKHVL